MLSWFKKKFTKQEAKKPSEDQKIPVAPREMGETTPQLDEDTITQVEESVSTAEHVEVEEPIDSSADSDTDLVERKITSQDELETSDNQTIELKDSIEQPTEPESSEIAASETPAEAEIVDQPDELPVSTEQAQEIERDLPEPETEVKSPLEVLGEPATKPKEKGFFSKLSDRLTRTRENFTYQLDSLFLGKKLIDADLLDDLEELLITADLGVSTTQEILDYARKKVKRDALSDPAALKDIIKEKLKSFIVDYQSDAALVMPDKGPFVIMVVGVNGVGKTTTIGKIAHKFKQSKQSVLLVAADTFRAAASSQLKIWGERNNVPVIAQHEGADPSSVVYDGIAHATAKGYDVVLVDTAGRLHTQTNLMEELKKIKRVMAKQLKGAPHEVMLVVDATTGQNGISQAKLFDAAVDLTGITLTKLDGTAKGGIVANICKELKTPIRFIGVGEQLEDLRDFDPDEFIEALFAGKEVS
ncbi:signal recognition particle-docking protein FtsY [Desulfosediminicola ganghwensis]|uniref:signal recognition particle-docking protein FtsY n=1 Tax=Desulfosediminicola ganghwensis TaxID=2569540 RepID=UPI0010AC6241|nr:signal recognition particle-docking protein FtsY [Desulfosediminicola ganghwensis]